MTLCPSGAKTTRAQVEAALLPWLPNFCFKNSPCAKQGRDPTAQSPEGYTAVNCETRQPYKKACSLADFDRDPFTAFECRYPNACYPTGQCNQASGFTTIIGLNIECRLDFVLHLCQT